MPSEFALPIVVALSMLSHGSLAVERIFLLTLAPLNFAHSGLLVHCPMTDTFHLIVGHLSLLMVGCIGVLIYKWIFAQTESDEQVHD